MFAKKTQNISSVKKLKTPLKHALFLTKTYRVLGANIPCFFRKHTMFLPKTYGVLKSI